MTVSLYQATGTSASTSLYLLAMGVVTAVSAYLLHETHQPRDRTADPAEAPSGVHDPAG